MKAALVGHKEVCKVLIGKGAEVDAAKEDVETALMLSASVGHKELCKMLIEKGADVNATRKNGWTALMKAALFGYKEVCKVLMEKGAKVGAENKDGWTALMFAAFSGHKKVCEFFLDNVNPVDREKRTLLMYAALYGKREICELLIDRGLDVNSVNIDKWTPLMLVSLNSHFEFLPDEYSPRLHFSPLYMYLKLLVHRDFVQVCKLLLDRGAKIDFTNIGGDTALSIAASVGFNKVCNLLLERGANLNIKNKKGLSPLLLSAQNRHFAVFTTLLEFGAKFNKKTKKIMKDNPDFYNPDIIHCLLSTGNFDKVSMDYFRVAQFLSIDFLIAKFCEIGEMNKERYIAIHFAAMNESSTPLKQLITNDTFQGFVNCSSNRNKLSPLRLALKYKLFNNAKILLSKGASPFYNTSNTYFRKNRNVLEEKKKLKKYVSSEMLFDLLKDKDLENAQKRIYGPNDPEHNESYKDIIKLEVTDNRNRNVFHYLAECVEDVSTSEFLNRAVELDSFSKDLLIQKDNSGARPIHVAILNSNPYFIQHVSCLEILSKHELNSECNSETIFDIVKNKRVSKETIEAIIKYLWKYYEEEGVHSILYSNKNNQQKLASLVSYLNEGNNIHDGKEGDRIIDHIVRTDFLAGIEYVKDSVVDIDNLFLLGVNFSSVHCLDFLKGKVDKEYLKNKINLHDLCAEGKVRSLEIVLKFMKDQLMTRDKDGKIPLQVATEENKHNVVNFLLGYDTTEDKVTNPYFEQEEIEIVREHRDRSGHSMMHSAAFALNPDMVIVFTKLGCKMDLKDSNGDRAIDYIIKIDPKNIQERGERLKTIYALLCGMLGEQYDVKYSNESIHMAIKMGEDELVKELINNGLVNAEDRECNTPLHLIVSKNNIELLRKIIDGVDYKVINNKGETALHLAKSVEAMETIFENAINRDISSKELLKISDVNGENVLHKFITRSQEEDMYKLIKYALDNGADKNSVITEGRNKAKNAINMARVIAEDENKETRKEGIRPYDKVGNQLLALLEEYQSDTSDMELREKRRKEAKARREEDEEDKKDFELVRMGVKKVNTRLSGSKRYAIHLAVERDDPELIHELVRLGADLNVEDKECITSYRLAVQKRNYESFECLLKLGDVLDVDSKGESVLEIATEEGREYSEIALKALSASSYKKNRVFFIVNALQIVLVKIKKGTETIDKVDIFLENLLENLEDKEGQNGKTLILKIIEANNLSLGILKKILEKRGVEKVFKKDDEGVSALGKIILMTEASYLKEVIKQVDKSENKVGYDIDLLDHIVENVEELINRNRINHLEMILDKYESSFAAKIGKDEQLGKLIYVAARKKKRKVVESLLRKFVNFTTKKEMAIDALRKSLSKAIIKGGAAFSKTNPELKMATWVIGSALKPKAREESKEEILYIDGIYRDGRWALGMEIEPRKALITYYKETVQSFKEMSVEEFKSIMSGTLKKKVKKVTAKLQDKLGSIEESYLTRSLIEKDKRKQYLERPEEELKGVLRELERYNKEYMEYKNFIESNLRKIKKREDLSDRIKEGLRTNYIKIIDARELLKRGIENYKRFHGESAA